MKRRNSIGLFFLCGVVSLCVGIGTGYLLKGRMAHSESENETGRELQLQAEWEQNDAVAQLVVVDEPLAAASVKEDKVNADTTYIVVERDMDTGNEIETCTKIPQKYIGMTRTQLIENLSQYEANPPLSELERGFVSVQLLSFSTNQIEVQMNYQYVEPTGSFYIVAYDNNVVVMLEDKRTVFLDTIIKVTDLPSEIQQSILQGLFIPNEESLYDFLESYTS